MRRTWTSAVLLATCVGCATSSPTKTAPPAPTATQPAPAPAKPAAAKPPEPDPLAEAETALAAGRPDQAMTYAILATKARPNDARAWLVRLRAERLAAAAAKADGEDDTVVELRLEDAKRSAARAVEAAPDDVEIRREAAFVSRDAGDFAEAAKQLRAALDKSPSQSGAGELVLALADCQDKSDDRAGAITTLVDFYKSETAAGRGAGVDAGKALNTLWALTVQRRDNVAAKAAFERVAAENPSRPEPSHMLGYLFEYMGDRDGALRAYAASIAAEDRAVTRLAMVRVLLAAGKPEDADAHVRAALAKSPTEKGVSAAVVNVVWALLRAKNVAKASALADVAATALPKDDDVIVAAGDAALAQGDLAEAAHHFETSPAAATSSRTAARELRTLLAMLRSGEASADHDAFADSGEPVPRRAPDETLLGFDSSAVFVRAEGTSSGRIVNGAMRIALSPPAGPPTPGPGQPGFRGQRPALGPTLRVEFQPVIDARAWDSLVFRARAESGRASLRVAILDGYDEAGSGFARSRWPKDGPGIEVGEEWTDVVVPIQEIAGFVPTRALPPMLARVRCFLVVAEKPTSGAAAAVVLDDIALRGTSGERVLANFDAPIQETALVYDGTCVPFERTLFNDAEAKSFVVPGTTAYVPHVLGDAYDKQFVGAGTGSVRLHHGEQRTAPPGPMGRVEGAEAKGPASASVAFRPDRDVRAAKAITFLARGAKGGERLRVKLQDAHDREFAGVVPVTAWPGAFFPRTVKADGALTLAAEWTMYRIPLDAYPDVDRAALAAIRFEFGEDVGNGVEATIYLDEIGLER